MNGYDCALLFRALLFRALLFGVLLIGVLLIGENEEAVGDTDLFLR